MHSDIPGDSISSCDQLRLHLDGREKIKRQRGGESAQEPFGFVYIHKFPTVGLGSAAVQNNECFMTL